LKCADKLSALLWLRFVALRRIADLVRSITKKLKFVLVLSGVTVVSSAFSIKSRRVSNRIHLAGVPGKSDLRFANGQALDRSTTP